jgi:hypothetical protein
MTKNIQRSAFFQGCDNQAHGYIPDISVGYTMRGPRRYVKIAILPFHRLRVCWQAVPIAV